MIDSAGTDNHVATLFSFGSGLRLKAYFMDGSAVMIWA